MKAQLYILGFTIALLSLAACNTPRQASRSSNTQAASAPQNQVPAGNDPTLIGVTSTFLAKDSTQIRVFVYIDVIKGDEPLSLEEFSSLYNLNYVMYSDYGTRDRLAYGNVPLVAQELSRVDNQIVAQFDLKKPAKDAGVLLMEISQTGTLKKVLNDLAVRFGGARDSDRFGIFPGQQQVPLRRHFVTNQEEIKISSLNGRNAPLQVYYYKDSFDAAASPMNTVPRSGAKSLKIDSSFTIQSGQSMRFTQEGLYYLLSDTTRTDGLGILVKNDRFPKMTYPEQLVEPLMYMSTNQEIKELQEARDSKKALDKYWLSLMNGNPELAQQIIRNFYTRVEDANRLFTTYKEGWKTDKGMIYIVLGPPDKVQRSKEKEVWVYDQRGNATNVNFTFNKRTNQFVDDHYELVRYVEYQPIWYPVVEAWRNGAIR
ncbi:GWxTD domain-containing protein [Arundinibacter roseus]|uniref:GWxTD domain-containing protein n=1 Tax=Arundinibacter roseus TaxID=2070510 RepID=A0A4R4KMT8_9BACT|nr:GWxTD domain-containing protein [Arundinibacter roseus]TDB67841.1 GWxTD domain-containing protein [Arundinibacter roseus]